MRQNRCEIGDLVRLVNLTPLFPTASPSLAEVNHFYRLCLGKTSRAIYVGDDGSPEVGVSEHVIASRDLGQGMLSGCTLSLEPGCLLW